MNMTKTLLPAMSLAAALALSGAATAQVPSGGPDAKGNAPLKHGHTINDGAAKPGRSSFTKGQAERHIVHAGYAAVADLTKGADGVWRATATKNGARVSVGLDFKGNIVEGVTPAAEAAATAAAGAAPAAPPPPMESMPAATTSTTSTTTSTASEMGVHHARHHRRHHRHLARCANPGPNGVACSGIDRNRNGISDKEDRAMKTGAKP